MNITRMQQAGQSDKKKDKLRLQWLNKQISSFGQRKELRKAVARPSLVQINGDRYLGQGVLDLRTLTRTCSNQDLALRCCVLNLHYPMCAVPSLLAMLCADP